MATPRGMRSKSIGHYILGKTIGEGTFGKVKLGTHILTGEKVAVKILEKERIVDVADVERVAREIHILKLVQHPHIIQLYEIIETPRQLYLIMEFCCGGELFDYIVAQNRVKESEAARFVHQIMAGVEQIHRMNVVHRDLKPENLLLDEQKNIKIVDFGLSNTYQDGQLLKTACGSPCYAAPEMVAGQRYVPSRCDVWSCGVILFALVCGYLPFEDQNTSALYRKILNADYQAPKFISEGVRDLISRMLNTDPETRYTISKIRTHPWYRQIPEAALPASAGPGSKVLEEDVLDQLDRFGFPRDYAAKCLEMGKHNHVTTTYHLFVEKKKRSGGFLKTMDQRTHAGFEGALEHEMELPAERGETPPPFQGKAGSEATTVGVPDADRAAGGTDAETRRKTPEPNYGNWAFPGQMPHPRTPPHAKRSAREASEASTHAEPPSHAPLSELAQGRAPGSRQGSRGAERRDLSGADRRKAPTPRSMPPAGTPTPGAGRSSTPSRGRPPQGLELYSARESSRPGTSQGNAPARPNGPMSSRAQYVNEARRRQYTGEVAAPSLAPVSARGANSGGRGGFPRPAEGAAATAASVAADLFGGQAWATVTSATAATTDALHSERGGGTKDRDESMRTCRGAFNVACTSSKAPRQIMQEIHKALTVQRVAFKQANAFLVRCQKQSCHPERNPEFFALKWRSLTSIIWNRFMWYASDALLGSKRSTRSFAPKSLQK